MPVPDTPVLPPTTLPLEPLLDPPVTLPPRVPEPPPLEVPPTVPETVLPPPTDPLTVEPEETEPEMVPLAPVDPEEIPLEERAPVTSEAKTGVALKRTAARSVVALRIMFFVIIERQKIIYGCV